MCSAPLFQLVIVPFRSLLRIASSDESIIETSLRSVFSKLFGRSSMQFLIRPAQFFCDSFAIADVADRAQHERSPVRDDRTETDFDRELRTITTPSVEIQICSHASRFRGPREIVAMMVVLLAKAFRYKHLDFLADQLVALVAKKCLALRIDLNDGSFTIDGDDGIRKGFQEVRRKEGVSHSLG